MPITIDLSQKIALVTGGTRGIGRACAEVLARAGATVIITGRADAGQVEAVARAIATSSGATVSGLQSDAADPEAVKALYKHINKTFGQLDIAVLNAGIMESTLLGMTSTESIERLNRVNVNGSLFNLQAAAKQMSKKGSGSIIAFSSVVARYGAPGQIAYCASKAALIGMVQAAAKELGIMGIRVNAVAPGMIDTDLIAQIPAERQQQVIKNIALGRKGQPEDIADPVLFLASDWSRYITGQILGIDGGMVI